MATAAQPLDFPDLMARVAPLLCGDPNKAMSKGNRLRFGTHGSMEIDTDEGWFDDHEAKARGGVLELIQHKRGCDMHGALSWLEDQGLKDRAERPAATAPTFYDYRDADGAVAYRVERRGKGFVPPFLQHGPDGKGGFHAARGCMQGVPRLPYRLPEMLAADPGTIVFVVEGEKDADRLARSGLIATTNSGGALKFGNDLVSWFEGRRVVIIPDNDDPGREHAEDVAAKLRPVAASLAVLDPLTARPKGDVSDWLAEGGSALQLVEQYAEPALAGVKIKPETLPLIDLAWWAGAEPEPRKFAVEKIMPAGEVTLFTGPGGVGKSQFAQQLATSYAAGASLFGLATAGGPVLYVTAEDDERELHWRQAHISRAIGISMHDVAGMLFPITLRGRLNNELATFDHEGRLHSTPTFALLRTTIEKTKASLVILDNIAHMFAGNENDRGQVTAFANLLAMLCRDYGSTVVLIGHPNKVGDDYSGSTAWLNAVRSQITLKRPEGDFVDPDERVLTLGKANYARGGEQVKFRWHDFAFVTEDQIPADKRAELAQVIQSNGENAAFLRCLAKATEDRRGVSHVPGSNYAPKIFAGMIEGRGVPEKAFSRAMERLIHLGHIRLDEPLWQDAHRHWKKGIKLAEGCGNPLAKSLKSFAATPAATPCGDLRHPLSEDVEFSEENCGDPACGTPPYTTYSPGAANAAAAPVSQWHSNPALGRRPQEIETRFPRPSGDPPADLSRTVFPASDAERAAVARKLTDPLPEHLRDPFNPEHWPEDDE